MAVFSDHPRDLIDRPAVNKNAGLRPALMTESKTAGLRHLRRTAFVAVQVSVPAVGMIKGSELNRC